MLRTALGFAGARDPSRRIDDAAALGRYQREAVRLVRSCLLQRRGAPSRGGVTRGVPCMLELLEKLDVAALNTDVDADADAGADVGAEAGSQAKKDA